MEGEFKYRGDMADVIDSLLRAQLYIGYAWGTLTFIAKVASLEHIAGAYTINPNLGGVYYLLPDLMRAVAMLKKEFKEFRKIKVLTKHVPLEMKKKTIQESYRGKRPGRWSPQYQKFLNMTF